MGAYATLAAVRDGVTDDTTLAQFEEAVKSFVVFETQLPGFPEISAGTIVGKSGATEDISLAASNAFDLRVDGSRWTEIALTLANCTTGSLTAAEMQTQIQAKGVSDTSFVVFKDVTVAFDAGVYTLTSGAFGEGSMIEAREAALTLDVPKALKISRRYGAVFSTGMEDDLDLQNVTVELLVDVYRRNAFGGAESSGTFGVEDIRRFLSSTDSNLFKMLHNRRRLVV